jgi:hypothetical protein
MSNSSQCISQADMLAFIDPTDAHIDVGQMVTLTQNSITNQTLHNAEMAANCHELRDIEDQLDNQIIKIEQLTRRIQKNVETQREHSDAHRYQVRDDIYDYRLGISSLNIILCDVNPETFNRCEIEALARVTDSKACIPALNFTNMSESGQDLDNLAVFMKFISTLSPTQCEGFAPAPKQITSANTQTVDPASAAIGGAGTLLLVATICLANRHGVIGRIASLVSSGVKTLFPYNPLKNTLLSREDRLERGANKKR